MTTAIASDHARVARHREAFRTERIALAETYVSNARLILSRDDSPAGLQRADAQLALAVDQLRRAN